jgi:protoheme IX farnesyltransferase
VTLLPILMFAIIFLWTPPHFWALALYRTGDYDRVGVPMLPVVAGPRATKIQMLIYTVLLFPLALAPWYLGMTGALYGAAAVLLGGLFILAAVRVLNDDSDRSARKMFAYSLFYLFALFALLILDRAPGLFAGGFLSGVAA